MFQFSCRFAFLLTFRILNRTPKITRILTLYQANERGNFDTMTLFSKGDKILHECKGYNARQFIKFLNKGWTKNSINRLRVSSEQSTGVRQRQTQCAYWWQESRAAARKPREAASVLFGWSSPTTFLTSIRLAMLRKPRFRAPNMLAQNTI